MFTDHCVHDLIRKKAAAPNAVAVRSGSNGITYQELETRSNQVAHKLRFSGVGAEIPVAICMTRSIDLVVAALGTLKAGGAYVPIDPGYPANRIAMLLKDSEVPLVLTQRSLATKIPAGTWEKIVLDEDAFSNAHSEVPPNAKVDSENLAYIIFTSGSTGRPKGVQVTHANLLNLISWHLQAFTVTSADKAMLYSSPGFDASVWELWPYLAAGASVTVVDEEVRTKPEALRDWMVAQGITISFLPTAIAELMINLHWPRETPLRVLLTGADALRNRPPKDLPFSLVNNYGPTECSVVATSGKVQPGESEDAPSIGRAISNVNIQIVDEKLQVVPPGTAGELLIGGAGVARGYLHSPETTCDRFLLNPFHNDPGARFYRTGDIGCFQPNGEITFLGRIDDQIKVMGYRIEPQEIVAVLNRYPGIRNSFVTARQDESGSKQLVAYVVPKASERLTCSELRAFLRDSLPDHMVPATFAVLSELPLSAHGKLDRDMLPAPDESNILRDESFAGPQSPIETLVAGFLSALLQVDRVGREDNFFTLGGHSLLGAQLIAKIQQNFGVELSLRSLFEQPTIRGMSAEIEQLIYAKVSAMSEDEAQQLLSSSRDRA